MYNYLLQMEVGNVFWAKPVQCTGLHGSDELYVLKQKNFCSIFTDTILMSHTCRVENFKNKSFVKFNVINNRLWPALPVDAKQYM